MPNFREPIGRLIRTKQISFFVSDPDYNKLANNARAAGCSMSELLRVMISKLPEQEDSERVKLRKAMGFEDDKFALPTFGHLNMEPGDIRESPIPEPTVTVSDHNTEPMVPQIKAPDVMDMLNVAGKSKDAIRPDLKNKGKVL